VAGSIGMTIDALDLFDRTEQLFTASKRHAECSSNQQATLVSKPQFAYISDFHALLACHTCVKQGFRSLLATIKLFINW